MILKYISSFIAGTLLWAVAIQNCLGDEILKRKMISSFQATACEDVINDCDNYKKEVIDTCLLPLDNLITNTQIKQVNSCIEKKACRYFFTQENKSPPAECVE